MWYSHLQEIKLKFSYLILAWLGVFSWCLYYKEALVFLITKLLIMKNKTFIFTKLTAAFITYMKINFLVSIIFVIPLGCWFIYLFLLKSFFNYQLQFFKYMWVSLIFYISISMYTIYTLLVQYLINFLLLFEKKEGFLIILLEARFDEFINFWIQLISGLLILFLLSIISLILSVSALLQNFSLRIYIGVGLYGLITLTTPPDIFLHFFLFLLFLILFEISLYILLFFKALWQIKFGESRIRTYDEY